MTYQPRPDDTLIMVEGLTNRGAYFCAGLILRDGICVHSAPILRWCRRQRWPFLMQSFTWNGWRWRPESRPAALPYGGSTLIDQL